jgi:metallo-beta-lactamase class B
VPANRHADAFPAPAIVATLAALDGARLMRRIALAILATLACQAADAKDAPAWHTPRDAFHVIGNTWYVGTEAITVLLIRGPQGAILIDTGVPESAASVLENIEAAGAKPSDIKLILTTHAHLDHVGAIAQMKAATGARVLASEGSKVLLEAGGRNDLHFADGFTYPPVGVDGLVRDGEILTVGDLHVTAHATPAHTPGSMSWTWVENEGDEAFEVAYVDSITAPGYQLVGHEKYPDIVEDFREGFAAIRGLACEILITPHPDASSLFERKAQGRLVDAGACKAYADRGEANLDRQIVAPK